MISLTGLASNQTAEKAPLINSVSSGLHCMAGQFSTSQAQCNGNANPCNRPEWSKWSKLSGTSWTGLGCQKSVDGVHTWADCTSERVTAPNPELENCKLWLENLTPCKPVAAAVPLHHSHRKLLGVMLLRVKKLSECLFVRSKASHFGLAGGGRQCCKHGDCVRHLSPGLHRQAALHRRVRTRPCACIQTVRC